MNPRSVIPRILLFGTGAIAAWALIPGRGEANAASWRSLNATSATFLQQGPAFAGSSSTGGASRSHLPNSTLPNGGAPGLQCSVDTSDPGAPPKCSTSASVLRCSAHCDNSQRCSAFIGPVPLGSAVCSTRGGVGRQCSVLQPVINNTQPSACSAFGGIQGTTIRCSIMSPGNGQKCSAQNPATFPGNACSTFPSGAIGGMHDCSVLMGGPIANYCSVGGGVGLGQVPKQCSTFAQNSQCSIMPGNKGICTTFTPSPAGTCSIFATASTCSVIGGANGSFCVQ